MSFEIKHTLSIISGSNWENLKHIELKPNLPVCLLKKMSVPDLQKLKPYDLESEILSLDGISTSSDEEELSSSDCEAESRIGKTYTVGPR